MKQNKHQLTHFINLKYHFMSKKLLNLCLASLLSVVCTAAWALSDVGGVYQIGTAEDLAAFAELVNGDNPYASAVLTADIVKPGGDVSMIGRDGQDFQGTFDGQGHSITINAVNNQADGTAVFRNVGKHALIKDLKVKGTITTDKKYAAGIAAWNYGTIRGCYVDVEVTSAMAGDATHAGIAAVTYQGAMIENCLSKFVVKGATTEKCGGISGWCSGRTNVINCLVINDGSDFIINSESGTIGRNDGQLVVVDLANYNQDIYENRPGGACANNYATNAWGNTKCVTVVPYANLADGRICYQLNTDQSHIAWVQRVGTDPFPVPAAFGTGQVYASEATGCNGQAEGLTYSNSGSDQAEKHQFDKFGICSVCGSFNFYATKRDITDSSVLLETPEDIDMAEGLNRLQNGGQFNLKMASDITYVAEPGRHIFNIGNWFDGNFNGDGHELTIEMSDMVPNPNDSNDPANASFFPQFSGTFENVIMHGSISASGKFAASITSHTRRDNVKIRNVFSDITINASYGGDNTTGGLIGVAETKTLIDNSIYAGNINGTENTECLAGLCGWSTGQTYWNNCAFIGTLNNGIGDSKTISRHPENVVCDNVYAITDYGYGDNEKFILYEGGEQGIKSGELAFYLNGKQNGVERFYQKIGVDKEPMPIKKEGALVYANAPDFRCDGKPLGETTYSNTYTDDPVIPDHQFDEGFCTVCGGVQEDYLTPVDGWYEISNGAELLWWSHYASKHLDASAKLTADIDMDGYSDRWADVGTEGKPFYGNFDGQYHIIRNLVVDKPETNGVGLVAVMNSLPSKGFGGISDADARAAEGVYIKNVVLDESCSLLGHGYIGIVGMTAPWAGHVTIEGLMMQGDVTANGGPNASGVFGCVMGSSCHVTINRSGMTGNVYGPKENGSFSGWLGSYAEVTNCYAVGSVEGIENNDRYFARYGTATITNCYARYGTQVPTVSEEDFASGALAWRANGSQFRTSYWYQTIGEDDYPFPDPSHGTVIFAANQYFSVADEEDLAEVATAIQTFETEAIAETIATQSVLDECTALINALEEASTILEFADAIDAMNVAKDSVAANAAVYQTYIDKCIEIKRFLEENTNFEGKLRTTLEYYLTEVDEPDGDNTLGTYEYIVENHTATAAEIKAETERVIKWLEDAIAEDYTPGTDVSNLIPNYDFSKKQENWTNGWSTGYGQIRIEEESKTVIGVEAWNVTGDQYQTVEGMKPGYYLVGINGAFRPSNNRYSYNYAAGIYANGIFNYFPTVIEDYVAANDTIDQYNCNLHGAGAHDLAIYDDYISTNADKANENGAELLGYAVHGETGMAAAANVGRYQVYTIAKVGADGKLTIGIKNPGTKYSNDWTGWGPLKVTYFGEEAGDALSEVLENMDARAETILEVYEYDEDNAIVSPNFPEALKEELNGARAQISSANTIEAKAALAKKFSDVFLAIYEGKQAYVALFNAANSFGTIESGNLPLVEKDEETGEWYETEQMVFNDEETTATFNAFNDLFDAYTLGTYSTEQAKGAYAENIKDFADLMPAMDKDGFYLIGSPKQLVAFRAIASYADSIAKAKVIADIDMTGIGMQPINTRENRYSGTFDGQAHAITNLYINHDDVNTGLFGCLDAATVQNVKLTGEYYSNSKFIGGITGYTYGNTRLTNCDVAVKIYSTVEGDGTHGGLIGVNETAGTVVNNCLVNCPMFGESTSNCGGVVGWATNTLTVKNTLILSQGFTVGSNESNTISRNPDNCSVSNVFYVEQLGSSNGTKVTAEQLASGEIAYRLNESKSDNPAWFQTLGTDATPHLFDGDVVYFYGGQYINEKPNPQLNAFAYDLDANLAGDNVIVAFKLNAEAESASVNFSNGYSQPVQVSKAGAYRAIVPVSKLGNDPTALSFEIAVTGKGSKDVLKIGDSFKVWAPYGMAINNNPASKGFGQVLIAETWIQEYPAGYISSAKPGALYAFDPTFKQINSADGTPGFYGGLDIPNETPLAIAGSNTIDLKALRFSEDGRLFVARASGTSNSSVWEINPDNLNESWKPIFKGGELDEATGITYVGDQEQNRMAVGLAVEGAGDNLKLYVLGGQRSNGDNNTTDYNCAFYNLGTATEWTTVPSGYITALDGRYTIAPRYVGIHEDGQGGLWYIQYRSTPTEENPAIKHFDADGNEDYSDVSTATYGGCMAVTSDGKYIAIPKGSGKIVLYETNYVPMSEGAGIFLNPKYNIATSETNFTSMAFDYANNLYVASGDTETFSRYVIPSWNDNKTVTPGNGIGTGVIGDVNSDGKVDGIDAQAILNIMSDDNYKLECDVNKDGKVDGLDYQTVLNIMSDM